MYVGRHALAQGVDSAVTELGVARRSVFPWLALSQYYNYHRLSGFLGWLTPAERFGGTPFTDRSSRPSPTWLISSRARIGHPCGLTLCHMCAGKFS